MISIVSYNVNGIRAAIKKGLITWLTDNQPDIICFQETKAQAEQVDLAPFHELGYQDYWFSAEKKGYSGVAIFSKIAVKNFATGCNHPQYDSEGRVMQIDLDDNTTLVNIYFPSGTTGDIRQQVKMEFLDYIFDWVMEMKRQKNVIIVGDYNIAHTEIDIHNPKSNKKTSGFLPEERAWLSTWFEQGLLDAFRHKNPTEQSYSWWSYRAGARKNNKGWRIDYISVSEEIQDKILATTHRNDAEHSDHCPVWMDIDLAL